MPEEIKSLLATEGDDTKGAASGGESGKQGGDQKTPEQLAAEKAEADKKVAAEEAEKNKGKTPEEIEAAKKADAEKKAAEEKAKADAVPEKYEFKLPEGVQQDEALFGQFTPIAKELGLSNAKAQKLVDLFVGIQKSGAEVQEKAIAKQRADWAAEVQKDPNAKENLRLAKKALRLADPETAKLFQGTWLGDHPQVIGYLAKVGALVGEDKLVEGAAGAKGSDTKSAAELFYPSQKTQ
jgi:hypothetical protein